MGCFFGGHQRGDYWRRKSDASPDMIVLWDEGWNWGTAGDALNPVLLGLRTVHETLYKITSIKKTSEASKRYDFEPLPMTTCQR